MFELFSASELALLILAAALAFGWWRLAARARREERLRQDVLNAFASRNDELAMAMVTSAGGESERLWRRLVTARAALEETANDNARARRDLEDVLASLQDAVLVVDHEARLRFLNAAASRLFDVRVEEVLGAPIIEALPSFGIDAAMRSALREGHSSAREIHLYSPRLREVFLRVAPVFSASGDEAGAVAIIQDLTELRRLERVRRDFVANASHELRTPIANIRATAETLQHAHSDPEVVERFLPHLIGEAERLSRLVADLLDLARAENHESAVSEPVDLTDVVANVVASLREKAGRRQIQIDWQPNGASPVVAGDAAGLEQVAFNLLDNAISYTPAGGAVLLRLSQRESPAFSRRNSASNGNHSFDAAPSPLPAPRIDASQIDAPQSDGMPEDAGARKSDDGKEKVGAVALAFEGAPEPMPVAVLEVSDSGIGIPEIELPRIFERFYRVDKARSRSEGGTGLGLAIVKHIVETHGGHVEVESRVGTGTTFRVELPRVTM